MADRPAEERLTGERTRTAPVTTEEELEAATEVVSNLEQMLRRVPKTRVYERGAIRYRLGLAYQELPTGNQEINLGRAVACLREAARLFDPSERPFEHALTQNALGTALRKQHEYEEAATAFQRAASLIARELHPQEYGAVQNNLGLVYVDLKRRDDAEKAFREALDCFADDEFTRWRITVLHSLGQLVADSDDPQRIAEGLDYYDQALEVTDPEEHSYLWGLLHHSKGVLYTAIEKAGEAVKAFKEALRVFTRLRFPFQYALTKNNLGLAYAQLGDVKSLQRAVAAYEDAVRVLDVRINREQWEQVYRNMELAESALEQAGHKATRTQHFVAAVMQEDGDALISMLRERILEHMSLPEPRRTDALAEVDHAILSLPYDEARRLSAAWMDILMELPQEQFLAALQTRFLVHNSLDDDVRAKANEILDSVIQAELLAPQRIRVRDTLYDMGYRRPGELDDEDDRPE